MTGLTTMPKPSTGDLVAGISVALVALPQSLAYAEIAGMPPQYGLFASALPPILAAQELLVVLPARGRRGAAGVPRAARTAGRDESAPARLYAEHEAREASRRAVERIEKWSQAEPSWNFDLVATQPRWQNREMNRAHAAVRALRKKASSAPPRRLF